MEQCAALEALGAPFKGPSDPPYPPLPDHPPRDGLGSAPGCHPSPLLLVEEGQTVCGAPADLRGRRVAEVGLGLRARCHQALGSWDYLFFLLIGFVIFAAGTVSAWAMGVVMVLYERYVKRKDAQGDPEAGGRGEAEGEGEGGERVEMGPTGRTGRTSSEGRGHPGNGDRKASHGV
ncbi:unnamed protein product [Arctogadus glacialis]